MYLAEFTIGSETWLQGAVHLPRELDVIDGAWREHLRAVVGYFEAVPAVRTSYRLFASPHSIRRVLFATTRNDYAIDLRRLLARFARLTADDSAVELPQSRNAYDRLAGAFPPLRCALRPLDLRAPAGSWIAADFRVAPLLAELCDEAAALGYCFAYHANFEAIESDGDWLKRVRRNALSIERLAAAPPQLIEAQLRLAAGAADATHLIEEVIGTDTPEAAEWLAVRLQRAFREQFAGQKLEPPSIEFDESALDCALSLMLHRIVSEDLTDSERLSLAISTDAWQALLALTPPARFRPQPVSVSTSDAVDDAATVSGIPMPYLGGGDYVFISYKRGDMQRVVPILDLLEQSGHRFWYDKGIVGGAEWDSEIEERLQRCRAVVLLASQAAVDSRYVRREVKFADALEKPLITIKLEDAVLTGGMNMLLTQYQMLDAAAPNFARELDRALRVAGAPRAMV